MKKNNTLNIIIILTILFIIILPAFLMFYSANKRLNIISNSIENISGTDLQYLSEEFDFDLSEKIKPYQVFIYDGACYVVLEINEIEKNMKDTLRNVINISEDNQYYNFDINNRTIEIIQYDKTTTRAELIKRGVGLSAYYYVVDGKSFVQIQKGGANVDRARFDAILKGE